MGVVYIYIYETVRYARLSFLHSRGVLMMKKKIFFFLNFFFRTDVILRVQYDKHSFRVGKLLFVDKI